MSAQTSDKAKTPAAFTPKNFLFVKDGYVFRKVFFDELLYLESEANYVLLHLASRKKIMVRSTINDFTDQLEPGRFIRIHRRFAVNNHFIEDIFPNELTIRGEKLPIGKSYREEVLRALGIRTAE